MSRLLFLADILFRPRFSGLLVLVLFVSLQFLSIQLVAELCSNPVSLAMQDDLNPDDVVTVDPFLAGNSFFSDTGAKNDDYVVKLFIGWLDWHYLGDLAYRPSVFFRPAAVNFYSWQDSSNLWLLCCCLRL